MSDDVLVKVDNVSKRFCRSLKRSLWYGLQDLGNEIGGRRHGGGSGLPQSSADVQLRQDEFWAVKDVSFELRRGECLGLIGRNGAGKTTLLRMLNGLIKPDTGRIEINGITGALIALGAGFNPLLTGRENIYINSSVLGLTKDEVDRLIPQIVDFAEIGSFIDSPVQSYSSGMQVRLGFSVAVNINCDLLLLDEVLAVGDAPFRAKCYEAIDRLKSKAATIFVSHTESSISRLCTSALLLQNGSPQSHGKTQDVMTAYNALGHKELLPSVVSQIAIREVKNLFINRTSIIFSAPVGLQVRHGESFSLSFDIESEETIEKSVFDLVFCNQDGDPVAEASNYCSSNATAIPSGESSAEIRIKELFLNPDTYRISLIIASPNFGIHYYWLKDFATVVVCGNKAIAPQQYKPNITVRQLIPSTSDLKPRKRLTGC